MLGRRRSRRQRGLESLCDTESGAAPRRALRVERRRVPRAERSRARVRLRLGFPARPCGREDGVTDAKEMDAETAEGLERLYRRYNSWLTGRLRVFVGADRAADVAQETYIRAAPYSVGGVRQPKALLLRIALNLVRDESRRSRRRGGEPADVDTVDPEVGASQLEDLLLKQVILTMPALYRDVFVMSRFGGMTYAEIAAARGLNLKTVEWRMSKALDHCSKQMGA